MENQKELAEWQTKAIEKLLEGGRSQKLSDRRYYIDSAYYGSSRYHVINMGAYDGTVVIDQVDGNERYQQRITFEGDELIGVLSVLLDDFLRREAEQIRALDENVEPLDDHPF